VNGATTIWERWNSYTIEDGFNEDGMNSFCHYAFGSVCEWMFENAAGIKAAEPAYRSVVIRPEVDERLGFLESEYESISGLIRSEWKFEEDGLSMQVSIPVNVDATIYVPAGSVDQVSEGGEAADEAAGLEFLNMEDGYAVFRAGSGDYDFLVSN
jgi:alpha-L-rhamnosidase